MSYNAYVMESHGNDLRQQARIKPTALELAPMEIMIKIKAAGVCHSDVHFWHGHYRVGKTKDQITTFSERGICLPLVPGHEIAGEVCAMGSQALAKSGFKTGDHVLVYPWIGCGHCPMCKGDEPNMCVSKSRELGFMLDGGFAEYTRIPDYQYVFHIPDVIPYEFACLIPCGGLTAFNAVKKSVNVIEQVGKRWKMTPVVGVIGLGGLGQWALKLLHSYFDKDITLSVIGMDISDSKATYVKKEGLVDQVP